MAKKRDGSLLMNKKAIIIFVKKPEVGKVKTRLASSIGDERALGIYKKLLEHTEDVVDKVSADTHVFYANGIVGDDLWNGHHKHLQPEGNLGEKMKFAFQKMFSLGYSSVVIIGSDCAELTSDIMQAGFEFLQEKEVVIGPCLDGGYYFLGMNNFYPDLMEEIPWSTSTVFSDTVAKMNDRSFAILPKLSDIDYEEDLERSPWLWD